MAKYNESAENYLETILMLSKKLPVVRSVDIATELGFKKSSVSVAMKNLKEIMGVLGILESAWNRRPDAADDKDFRQLMQVILDIRQEARTEKQYAIADRIRDRLAAMDIVIEDTPTGARWKKRGV